MLIKALFNFKFYQRYDTKFLQKEIIIHDPKYLTWWAAKDHLSKLIGTKNIEISGYHGFSFIGRSGPTRHEKLGIIEKRRVPEGPICRLGWHRFFYPK